MNIIDIRNFYVRHKVVLVEAGEEFIYYTEEKTIDGKRCLFLLRYGVISREETVLYVETLGEGETYVRADMLEGMIQLVTWEQSRGLWVTRVDRESGKTLLTRELMAVGKLEAAVPVAGNCLLAFYGKSEEEEELFEEYRQWGGRKLSFLFSIDSGERRLVQDKRVSQLSASDIHSYRDGGGEEILLLCEAHVAEDVKRYLYNEKRSVWLGKEEVRDSIWKIPAAQLVKEVFQKLRVLSLDMVCSASVDGYVRYIGMGNGAFYYRSNFFPADIEKVFSCRMEDGQTEVCAELDLGHLEKGVSYCFLPDNQGYRLTEKKEEILLQGVWNSDIEARFPKKLGKFTACVENRYLILAFDRSGEQPSWFLYDIQTGEEESFQGNFAVAGDNLVLYC